jgi:hypothetical protein
MKWLIIGVGYVVLIAAVGCVMYGLLQFNQRKMVGEIVASSSENSARAARTRSSSPTLEYRRAIAETVCAAHTPDCWSDRSSLARSPADTKTQVTPPPSTVALRRGSLAASAPILKATRSARDRQRRMVSHHGEANRQVRKVRSATRRRPYPVYADRYRPRTAYTPWWGPRQIWGPY